jgi:cell wall assembly regulator SMI1
MEKIWKKIEAWLEENAPDTLQDLRPGASDADVRKAEKAFSARLPEDVVASYSVHDGARGGSAPLFGDYNSSGDFLCLDLDPARPGKPGQIVSFLRADPARELVARDFKSWLSGFAKDLEAGKYKVDKGYLTKKK